VSGANAIVMTSAVFQVAEQRRKSVAWFEQIRIWAERKFAEQTSNLYLRICANGVSTYLYLRSKYYRISMRSMPEARRSGAEPGNNIVFFRRKKHSAQAEPVPSNSVCRRHQKL